MDNRYSRDRYGSGANAQERQMGPDGALASRNGEFEFESNPL